MTPEMLHLRDEILQILFWRKGEGLGEEADAKEIGVFLGSPTTTEADVRAALEQMHRDGMIELADRAGAYRLTALGLAEGGRRFGEAFADHGLGGGHGSCGPECQDCLVNGAENCPAHQEHDHGRGHDHGSGAT